MQVWNDLNLGIEVSTIGSWDMNDNASYYLFTIFRESVSTVEASRDSVQRIGDIMHRNMRQIKVRTIYGSIEIYTKESFSWVFHHWMRFSSTASFSFSSSLSCRSWPLQTIHLPYLPRPAQSLRQLFCLTQKGFFLIWTFSSISYYRDISYTNDIYRDISNF